MLVIVHEILMQIIPPHLIRIAEPDRIGHIKLMEDWDQD